MADTESRAWYYRCVAFLLNLCYYCNHNEIYFFLYLFLSPSLVIKSWIFSHFISTVAVKYGSALITTRSTEIVCCLKDSILFPLDVFVLISADAPFAKQYLAITNGRPTLGLRVGGLPASAPCCGWWLHQTLSVCVGPLYHSKLHDGGAFCFCRATGLRVLAIFAVTSLCFAKEHRADKGRGVIRVCPTVGKARAQELEQERQDGDLKTEMCVRG